MKYRVEIKKASGVYPEVTGESFFDHIDHAKQYGESVIRLDETFEVYDTDTGEMVYSYQEGE